MADGDSVFNEVRGLHALGNPSVETRSADGGPTGSSPIGGKIWGGILARGSADNGLWRGRGGLEAGRESLRKANSR